MFRGGFKRLGGFSAFFVAGISLSSFLFTSCENFLNGSSLLENLEKQMNYVNAPYASVTITSVGTETASLIPPAGSYSNSYKAGDSINLKFEPQVGYRFVKWIATPGDAVLFTNEKSDSTIAEILSSENPITIQPYVVSKEKLIITFKSKYGTTVPAEKKELYLNDEFALSSRENSGYAFIGWKITDDETGLKISNALELSGTGADVTAKVTSVSKKITVEAICVKRPKVVSTTPLYDSNGVYRDRRICVMFDKKMDLSSIYYDETKEVPELIAAGYTLLRDSSYENKCYGYMTENDEDTIVYKSISITTRTNSNINLLKYFNPPYFDSTDSSVLRIDAKQNENAPPSVTDVLVTVGRSFNALIENNNIEISEDYSWAYYTNGNLDNELPKFTDSDDSTNGFIVTFAKDDQSEYKSENHKLNLANNFIVEETADNKETYKNNNLTAKKIWVRGAFSDGGSGPSALKWELYKVSSEYYQENEDIQIQKGQIDALDIIGANARIAKTKEDGSKTDGVMVDLNKLESEGTYRIDFLASDKNEQTARKSYYFVYDETPPKASTLTCVSTQAKDAVTVKKSGNNTIDFSYSEVNDVTLAADVDKAFTRLGADSRKHTFVIKDYDLVGNCRTTTQEIVSKPSVGMIYYSDGYWSTDYDNNHEPEGAICKVDSDSKFYIWDIWDQYGYCWGVPGLKIKTEYDSGIVIYDKLMNQFGETIMKQNGFSRKQTSIENEYSPSMWTYIIDKNKEVKPADVSSEKWFIPSANEMYYVFNNLETLETSFNKISAGYGHTDREKIYKFAYRQVQLIQSSHFSFYWTCTLHNTYKYHCCPVAFNCDVEELYLSMYGLSDWGNTWHSYKGTAFRMGVAKINNNSYSDNYIMDRCNRNCNDKYDTIDGEWRAWDMKTHAMALVEMK